MARYSVDHIPKYQHYKRTNRGVVKIAGKPILIACPCAPRSGKHEANRYSYSDSTSATRKV